MTDQTKDRAEKIRKLLAKAERAGSQEEAEAFAAKAQELMTKWQIDEMMVANADPSKRGSIGTKTFRIGGTYSRYDILFYQVAAEANSCRTFFAGPYQSEAGRNTYDATLIGYPSDLERTEMLGTSLLLQASRLAGSKATPKPSWWASANNGKRTAWRKAFRAGFAQAVQERLQEGRDQAIAEADSGDFLPVLASREEEVEAKLHDLSPDLRPARRLRVNGDGYASGQAAGGRADIGSSAVAGNMGAVTR